MTNAKRSAPPSATSRDARHTVLICTTCAHGVDPAPLIAALTRGLPGDFDLRTVDCMAGCDRPRTVGFQAVDKASYLFGDIEFSDVDALLAFARQYRDTKDGWTSATHRPRALFKKTLARLPACLNTRSNAHM